MEIDHFQTLAQEWWNEKGKFRGLHAFNPARISFILNEIRRDGIGSSGPTPLAGVTILDIGCGGGILCEPLARLGGTVLGIDPVPDAIQVAAAHAASQHLSINYQASTAEALATTHAQFDVVIASEVIEHVSDRGAFLTACRALCKAGGLLILSTLNRTAKSYALAIVAAERFLGLIPQGTHDWDKFVKPVELEHALKRHAFQPLRQRGIVFELLGGVWALSERDLSVNYIASAKAA